MSFLVGDPGDMAFEDPFDAVVGRYVLMFQPDPVATLRRGIKLHRTFVDAGLPAPSMRLESVIAGGATAADQVHFEMDLVGTLVPEMVRLGLVAADQTDFTALADQVLEDATGSDSVIVGRAEIGAWSRTAG